MAIINTEVYAKVIATYSEVQLLKTDDILAEALECIEHEDSIESTSMTRLQIAGIKEAQKIIQDCINFGA